MAIEWIGYCLLTSGLLALCALAGERALTHYGRPVRWAWAGAIAGSVLLPLGAFLVPAVIEALSPIHPIAPRLSGSVGLPIALSVSGPVPEGASLADILGAFSVGMGWLWALSALALAGFLTVTYRRLRSEMRDWTPTVLHDAPVMLSERRGPAVVGVRRGVIVMPKWIAELEDDVLRLVFLHEREHQRAGDQRLFAVALAAVVCMPWNPFVWWEMRRLRLAIEYDCDQRVLARGIHPRAYADALLEVGSRVSRPPLAAAAFAEHRSAVEQRLRRLTAPFRRLRGPRAALAVALGVAALALAFGVPFPRSAFEAREAARSALDAAREVGARALGTAEEQPALGTRERPAFIPYDRPPTLNNRMEVQDLLREARSGLPSGRVELYLYVDERGEVQDLQVKTSSGIPALDEAAARVGWTMRFFPAVNRDKPTPVWVSQFITFGEATPRTSLRVAPRADGQAESGSVPLIVVDGVIQPEGTALEDLNRRDIEAVEIIKGEVATGRFGDRARNGAILITTREGAATPRETSVVTENPARRLPPPPAGGSAADRPSFLPYDTPPVLANRDAVMSALQEAYPDDLRDAGVGGRVELWVYIDVDGRVLRHQVKTASGNARLDEAAGQVVEAMIFEPAEHRGEPTAIWMSQWITFEVM